MLTETQSELIPAAPAESDWPDRDVLSVAQRRNFASERELRILGEADGYWQARRDRARAARSSLLARLRHRLRDPDVNDVARGTEDPVHKMLLDRHPI